MSEPNRPDDRVRIPLDPVDALRALLKVDPEAEPDEDASGGPNSTEDDERSSGEGS